MSLPPAAINLFKANNRNGRKRCKICSKLTITPERRHWRCSGFFIVNFEHISHLFVVFLYPAFEQVNNSWVTTLSNAFMYWGVFKTIDFLFMSHQIRCFLAKINTPSYLFDRVINTPLHVNHKHISRDMIEATSRGVL